MVKYGKREDYFYDGTHYISKGAYYRGASFLIYPSWEEVNRGILIPGDRWHPFCPSSLAPWDITLVHEGRVMPTKEISYPFKALQKYHQLMGKELLLMNLWNNLPYNRESFTLPVLDMGDYYRRHQFQTGDALRIHVVDYQEGIYTAEYVNTHERTELEQESNSWLSLMERSMEKVINLFGDKLILPRQIDWAHFMGGRRLIDRPAMNVSHFLDRTEQFSLSGDDGVYFLVKK